MNYFILMQMMKMGNNHFIGFKLKGTDEACVYV